MRSWRAPERLPMTTNASAARDLYLDLLARALVDALHEDGDGAGVGIVARAGGALAAARAWIAVNVLHRDDVRVSGRLGAHDPVKRWRGPIWPHRAHTMIGMAGLDNLRSCVEDVIARGVPGDLVETGVWRGGASIFMRGILAAHGVTDRTVWVADSFQ